jgi:hypothetical protein
VESQEKWSSRYFDEEAKAHAYEALASVDTFVGSVLVFIVSFTLAFYIVNRSL